MQRINISPFKLTTLSPEDVFLSILFNLYAARDTKCKISQLQPDLISLMGWLVLLHTCRQTENVGCKQKQTQMSAEGHAPLQHRGAMRDNMFYSP